MIIFIKFLKIFRNFPEFNWKLCILLSILNALFVHSFVLCGQVNESADRIKKVTDSAAKADKTSENTAFSELEMLKAENKMLKDEVESARRKLIETLELYRKQTNDIQRLKLSVVASLAENGKTSVNEKELLTDLNNTLLQTRKFSIDAIEYTNKVMKLLDQPQMDSLAKTRLRIAGEELSSSARNLIAMSSPPENRLTDQCRILEINEKLRLVILSAGYSNGLICGLKVYSGEKRDTQLKIISVRPFISAAVLESGSFEKLAPGMTVYINKADK